MGVLSGRVAIVTGAGGGIGGAIARAFAAEGARVGCLDLVAPGEVVAGIVASGGETMGVAADVSDEGATLAAVGEVVARWGGVGVLVNGAAPDDPSGTVLEMGLEDWERVFAVHVRGAFLMSRAVLPHMVSGGGGSIIHIASQMGRVGAPGRPAYCAAKGALIQLARAMALDHAGAGVRVNALSPGAVETRRMVYRHGSMEAARAVAGRLHPIGRLGRVEEVAAAALFLAGDGAGFITGSDLLVDGGYTAV